MPLIRVDSRYIMRRSDNGRSAETLENIGKVEKGGPIEGWEGAEAACCRLLDTYSVAHIKFFLEISPVPRCGPLGRLWYPEEALEPCSASSQDFGLFWGDM